jgi:acyl-CoA thioesterase
MFALDSRQTGLTHSGSMSVDLSPDWTAPALFGGMALACALRLGELTGPSGMVPLSAAATFHRPLMPGTVQAAVTELARSRSTRTVQVRLAEALTVTAQFAAAAAGTLSARPRADAPVVPAPERLRPVPVPAVGSSHSAAAVARQVHWRAITAWTERSRGGEVLAWLAPRRVPWVAGGYLDPLWYAVAADLLGPAVYHGTPFAIATASLDIQFLGRTRSPWLLQRVTADDHGPWPAGRVELWDRAGRLVATAAQRARGLDAPATDLPWSVTAFGSGRARLIPAEA